MHWAGLDHALLGLPFGRAELATVESFDSHLAGALLKAQATGSSARAPFSPFANLAVSGAGEGAAASSLGKFGTLDATILGLLGDLAGTRASTTATSLGALGVFAPGRVFTVDRARTSGAVLFFFGVGALVPTLGLLLDHNAGANVGTLAAGLGAGAVLGPGTDLAVHGASLGVAGLGIVSVFAYTAEKLLAGNLLEARLVAATTGDGAFLEGAP
jgi:hypothetical protein